MWNSRRKLTNSLGPMVRKWSDWKRYSSRIEQGMRVGSFSAFYGNWTLILIFTKNLLLLKIFSTPYFRFLKRTIQTENLESLSRGSVRLEENSKDFDNPNLSDLYSLVKISNPQKPLLIFIKPKASAHGSKSFSLG